MLANYARIMWISVPRRGSVNGKEKGRGGEDTAGVVGYNESLSREMTADGNRDVEIYRKEIARIIAAILHA